jgi:hypothetical protein
LARAENRNRKSRKVPTGRDFWSCSRLMPLVPFPFSLLNSKLLCGKCQRKNAGSCKALIISHLRMEAGGQRSEVNSPFCGILTDLATTPSPHRGGAATEGIVPRPPSPSSFAEAPADRRLRWTGISRISRIGN